MLRVWCNKDSGGVRREGTQAAKLPRMEDSDPAHHRKNTKPLGSGQSRSCWGFGAIISRSHGLWMLQLWVQKVHARGWMGTMGTVSNIGMNGY